MRRRCITTRSEVAEVVWTPANDQIAKSNVAAVANRKSPGESRLVLRVGELEGRFFIDSIDVSQSRADFPQRCIRTYGFDCGRHRVLFMLSGTLKFFKCIRHGARVAS